MDLWGNQTTVVNGGTNFARLIDMRQQIHNVIFGSVDVPAQGQPIILREFNDVQCPGCWNKDQGGTNRPNCAYCQGEGYQFTERMITGVLFAGVAPVYKPAILGSGQYPLSDYGDTDPNRYTGYVEWNIYPNYDRYTLPQNLTPNKLYQVKVDSLGRATYGTDGRPVRAAKWKILSVTPIRGDQGRVEYFELGLIKENVS
jgi:hypothetical protein